MKNAVKDGDIIARTTIPDRVVFLENGKLYTRKVNNNRVCELSMGAFDIIIGNKYINPELLVP